MTHGHPPARMTAAAPRRGKGRPPARRTRGLRERAWWLMRKLPRFTLDELLFTLAEGTERDASSNLQRYIRRLERVGILTRLMRREPGRALTSNGHVIWRLQRDLGREAPLWREAQQGVYDPNSDTLIPLLPDAAAASKETAE